MNGCFKGLFRLFLVVLLLLGVAAAWWFRAPLKRAAERLVGKHGTALPAIADTVGAPTPRALQSALGKMAALGQRGGPDSVSLNANEMASLVGNGIDWTVRKTFDSLRVELAENSLAVHCRLDTRLIPPDALGPLRGLLAEREPLRIAGPIAIARPGIARWTVRELNLRGLPLPAAVVRSIARQAAGADTSGAVAIKVDPAIADVRVHPTVVVLYRRRRA